MKYTIQLLLIFFVFLASCSEDEERFEITMPLSGIHFKPIQGGAVMYYKVPKNRDVFSIQVAYTDAVGNQIVKQGSYACDSLELTGFNEGREVPVSISLRDRNDRESEKVETTFKTLDSAPVAFFYKADVQPYWNGFQVTYEGPELVEGFANVFFIGTNPMTKKLDTLLLKTVPIKSGKDTLLFSLDKPEATHTVVIRTENFQGYKVKQQIWNNVEAYNTAKLDNSGFELLDPLGLSRENDNTKLSWKYLFDGDTKGTRRLASTVTAHQYTFSAGMYAVGKYVILDIKEPKMVSNIRLYGILNTTKGWPNDASPRGAVWGSRYYNKLPNEVTVYASNDKDDDNSWVEVAYFYESPNVTESSWMHAAYSTAQKISSVEELEAADPAYLSLDFPTDPKEYRYFKIEVNSTFNTVESKGDKNGWENVTFHEIEVYAKKD